LGRHLWTLLFGDKPQERRKLINALRQSTPIQVSRVRASTFVFPWALVYQIPLESDPRRHKPCRLLEDRSKRNALADGSLARCPYESDHGKNSICPFGFWGFKHIIEQPPSMPSDRSLPTVIQVATGPREMVMGLSLQLDADLTKAHLAAIRERLSPDFAVQPRGSLSEISDALKAPALELLYFYCHGRREPLPGSREPIPYLGVGSDERLTPDDIITWSDADWSTDHWQRTSPLVFINGCHTAELTPESLTNFVDVFTGAYAAGVIGTEVTLLQPLAGEAAQEFFGHFRKKNTVGEALQRMRLHFLSKGNLLGLAYTAYCSAGLTLSES